MFFIKFIDKSSDPFITFLFFHHDSFMPYLIDKIGFSIWQPEKRHTFYFVLLIIFLYIKVFIVLLEHDIN